MKARLFGKRLGFYPATPNVPTGDEPVSDTIGLGAEGLVVDKERVKTIIIESLSEKLESINNIKIGDNDYYLPTEPEYMTILTQSLIDRRTYLYQRFDCDDFAHVLKGEFSIHWYSAGESQHGICFGLMWGFFNWQVGPHAINWVIDAEETMVLIEPQTDEVYPVSECESGVKLVLV